MANRTRRNGKKSGEDGWTPERSVAGDRNPWTIIGVISIATLMVVLDTSIANVALNHIAGGLSASYDEATWVVTSFLVANSVVIPISGWLADVIGRKRYYMISVALFTLASLLCGIAPSLGFLVIARILQGIGGGGLAPVEQSMLIDTFAPKQRGLAFALYGVVVVAGPVFGPTLGGWITDNYSWHWVFLINLPIGIASLVLVSLYVDEPEAIRRRADDLRARIKKRGLAIDWVGFLLVALFLGCLEVVMDRGQRDDWFSSALITACTLISAGSFLAFVPWELRRDDPIVKIKLFCRRNFGIASILLLMTGTIIFGTTQFIPQFLQQVMGYTATEAGLALTAGGLATLAAMPVSGLLTGRVDARIMVGIAFVIEALALWSMTDFNTQISFDVAAKARMWQSLGVPFLFVPITAVAYVGLKPDESNQASALMNVARNLGGSIGISIVQTLLLRHEQFHQARYVETLNPLNPYYVERLDQIARALMGGGMTAADAHQGAIAQLYGQLTQQAIMLSYLDIFKLLAIAILCAMPLILLMQKPDGPAPAHGGH
ncbi:MAG: DHA2 family efflux MFS transporter permease subunit [Alphaproteobacteria bacterium]|nr:DHA2 family efflux MFS transporter permease subunit [Alphaproteobacteria bacterium]